MILLAQAAIAAMPAYVQIVAGVVAVGGTLLYWSLARNVVSNDQTIGKLDAALAESFKRIQVLERKADVQENELRHLNEHVDLAAKIDALPDRIRDAG